MPFKYLGDSTLTYVQHLDMATGTTLVASPGGSYDIAPAGSLDFPVPPADGLWEADSPAKAPVTVPPPLMTTASTEDEGK